MSIDWNEVATGLVVAVSFALLVWAIHQRAKVVAAQRRLVNWLKRQWDIRAGAVLRWWWVSRAKRANQQVAVRYVGHRPTKVVWKGACSDEDLYFHGDLPRYKRHLGQAPRKSHLHGPPRLGTRRPCSC